LVGCADVGEEQTSDPRMLYAHNVLASKASAGLRDRAEAHLILDDHLHL
jgi:hypothetical protein